MFTNLIPAIEQKCKFETAITVYQSEHFSNPRICPTSPLSPPIILALGFTFRVRSLIPKEHYYICPLAQAVSEFDTYNCRDIRKKYMGIWNFS